MTANKTSEYTELFTITSNVQDACVMSTTLTHFETPLLEIPNSQVLSTGWRAVTCRNSVAQSFYNKSLRINTLKFLPLLYVNHLVINKDDTGFLLLTIHTFYLQSKIMQISSISKHQKLSEFFYIAKSWPQALLWATNIPGP